MSTRPELKNEALGMLRGKWTQPVVAALIVTLVSGVTQGGSQTQLPSFITIGFLVALLIAENLQYGFSVGMLRFNRGRENTVNEMISAGFKEDYGRVLGIMLLGTVYILLWCLLLIIPGIIKAYAFSMAPYIAEDNPELADELAAKIFEALEKKAEGMAKKYDCPFVDNEMPYGRVPKGHPVIVDYFYHEEIRGSENTGKRTK